MLTFVPAKRVASKLAHYQGKLVIPDALVYMRKATIAGHDGLSHVLATLSLLANASAGPSGVHARPRLREVHQGCRGSVDD